MILKAAHSFGNLRLDNDTEPAINQSQADLAKTCETKTIDHREQVRGQKQAKTAVPIKIAPHRENKLIRWQTKLSLWAEQSRPDKTAQAADARKRAVNLPYRSGGTSRRKFAATK